MTAIMLWARGVHHSSVAHQDPRYPSILWVLRLLSHDPSDASYLHREWKTSYKNWNLYLVLYWNNWYQQIPVIATSLIFFKILILIVFFCFHFPQNCLTNPLLSLFFDNHPTRKMFLKPHKLFLLKGHETMGGFSFQKEFLNIMPNHTLDGNQTGT